MTRHSADQRRLLPRVLVLEWQSLLQDCDTGEAGWMHGNGSRRALSPELTLIQIKSIFRKKKKKERKRKTEKRTVLGFVELQQYQNVKELLSGPKKKWTKKKGKVRRFPAFKWSFRV